MHADLMVLYLLYLHDFHKEVKLWQNCCQSYYYLVLGVILV